MIGVGLSIVQLSVRQLLGGTFSPIDLFTTGVNGAWYDPSDINLAWRRNLLTYTEQFDNAVWGKSNFSVVVNSAIAPDGTITADKCIISSGTFDRTSRIGTPYNQPTSPLTYTISAYFKSAGADFAGVTMYGSNQAIAIAQLQFSTGNLTICNRLGYMPGTGTAVNVGDGWWRISFTLQSASNIYWSGGAGFIASTTQINTNVDVVTGDGTSGIYIWGAQLELGSTATPYQRITDGIQDYLQYQAQPVLYRDAAGTQPVTAVEQPVGLMKDKSGRNNHAFNSSGNSANFPVLSARYNQYLSTETLATQNVTTVAASYKLAFTGTGSITLSGTATGTYSAGTHTITCTAGTLTSTVSGTVTQADLRVANDGVNLPAYQRVNTPSDYDTVGFKQGEVFDGINDYLTASAGGGSTTSFFWCSAIRVGKVGAVQTLFSDAGTNTGYRVRINASNQLELSAGNGTSYTTVSTTATLSIGQRSVLTAWHDGINLNVQINNGTVHQVAVAAATAGTAQFTIGKDNNAASNFFAGWLYEKVYTKDNVPSVAQIADTKSYVANIAGITL